MLRSIVLHHTSSLFVLGIKMKKKKKMGDNLCQAKSGDKTEGTSANDRYQ